jgi:hypothetical protein
VWQQAVENALDRTWMLSFSNMSCCFNHLTQNPATLQLPLPLGARSPV